MMKGLSLALLVAAALALAGCEAEETGSFDKRGFMAELSSDSTIKDVAISDNGGLIYVGVLHNGSSRDGFASYVCEVARSYATGDLNSKNIKILDVAAAARDERKEIGENYCEM